MERDKLIAMQISIVSRLAASFEEIIAADEYDCIIVNFVFEATLKDMQDVVSGINNGTWTRYKEIPG